MIRSFHQQPNGYLWPTRTSHRSSGPSQTSCAATNRQSEYGRVILPFTVLRRLDCVLEPTKAAVLKEKALREKAGLNPEPFLLKKAGQHFYNTSPLDMKKLMGDQANIGENLRAYVQAFSAPVRDIFERFEFHIQIDRLEKANLLYLVTEKFANIDLHFSSAGGEQRELMWNQVDDLFTRKSFSRNDLDHKLRGIKQLLQVALPGSNPVTRPN